MEKNSTQKRLILLLTKAVTIMVLLTISVQAQDNEDIFPMDDDFAEDSEENTLPLDKNFNGEMILPVSQISSNRLGSLSSHLGVAPSPEGQVTLHEYSIQAQCCNECLPKRSSPMRAFGCSRICRQNCMYIHFINSCIRRCHHSMPPGYKSDKKKAKSYKKGCRRKCRNNYY